MSKTFGNKKTIFLMVFPGIALILFVIFIPILISLYYGFTNYSGFAGSYSWVGLSNYIRIFTKDPQFWNCLKLAFQQAVIRVIIVDGVCIVMAIAIDYMAGRWESLFRVVFFIPCTISVVVWGKLFVQVFNPSYGLINKLLNGVGLSSLARNWLSDPNTAVWSVHFMIIWIAFGWSFLYYYAGVKNISGDLYEAAMIDGCSRFKMYTRITIPLLRPAMEVCITLDVIASLKQMEIIMLTTNGGPGYQTRFLANYIYQLAFDNNQYGYGNAVSVIFVIVCILTMVLLRRLFAVINKD